MAATEYDIIKVMDADPLAEGIWIAGKIKTISVARVNTVELGLTRGYNYAEILLKGDYYEDRMVFFASLPISAGIDPIEFYPTPVQFSIDSSGSDTIIRLYAAKQEKQLVVNADDASENITTQNFSNSGTQFHYIIYISKAKDGLKNDGNNIGNSSTLARHTIKLKGII